MPPIPSDSSNPSLPIPFPLSGASFRLACLSLNHSASFSFRYRLPSGEEFDASSQIAARYAKLLLRLDHAYREDKSSGSNPEFWGWRTAKELSGPGLSLASIRSYVSKINGFVRKHVEAHGGGENLVPKPIDSMTGWGYRINNGLSIVTQ